MEQTHDYVHHYRGYWSDGGRCRIRIYREEGREPVVVCSQLPENANTSVTNMSEYIAAGVLEEPPLATPLVWIERYPRHRGKVGEWSLVRFSSWEAEEVLLRGARRRRVGSPHWSHLAPEAVEALLEEAHEES